MEFLPFLKAALSVLLSRITSLRQSSLIFSSFPRLSLLFDSQLSRSFEIPSSLFYKFDAIRSKHSPLWVKDTLLLEDLGHDWDSGVDWVGDDQDEGLWSIGSDRDSDISDNRSIDLID